MPPLLRQTDNAEDSSDDESNSEDEDFPEEAQERPARMQTHPMFGAAAVDAICSRVWDNGSLTFVPAKLATTQGTNDTPDIEHFCAPVVHPRTGEVITKYAKLANDPDPKLRKTW